MCACACVCVRAVNALLFAFILEAAAGQLGDLSREEMKLRSTQECVCPVVSCGSDATLNAPVWWR